MRKIDKAFHDAVMDYEMGRAKRLLKPFLWRSEVADINSVDEFGTPILIRVILDDCSYKLDFLLENGADINVRDKYGNTALHRCVETDKYFMDVWRLTEKGIDVNAQNQWGQTSLIRAIKFDQNSKADYLITHNADLDICDNNGCSPLWYAASRKNSTILQHLVEQGANVNCPANDGSTPLMWAITDCSKEDIYALIDAGADIHSQLNNGLTPVMFAAARGDLDVLRDLEEKGADMHATVNGQTILDIAKKNRNRDIITYLEDKFVRTSSNIHKQIVMMSPRKLVNLANENPQLFQQVVVFDYLDKVLDCLKPDQQVDFYNNVRTLVPAEKRKMMETIIRSSRERS